MSRTRKDRPHWVIKNDPTADRYAQHHHLALQNELVGEEPVYKRVPTEEGWHWEDKYWYTRKLYKRWYVNVDCTLDVPEVAPSSWRFTYPRIMINEDRLVDKNCYWQLEYYPNGRSEKSFKQSTNRAARSKVKQQLHSAVRTYGSLWDEDDWYDVDIFLEAKNVDSGWY
jgi:hypothetical protein